MHSIEIDATLKLAKTRLRAGKIAEAEAMYRRVLQNSPDNAEAVHFLGIAALQQGKHEEAMKLVRRSIELAPDKAEYYNNLATVLGKTGRAIEALGAAQEAIDRKADFPEAYGNKGVALEQLGRVDEAIEAYRKAAELNPNAKNGTGTFFNPANGAGFRLTKNVPVPFDFSVFQSCERCRLSIN